MTGRRLGGRVGELGRRQALRGPVGYAAIAVAAAGAAVLVSATSGGAGWLLATGIVLAVIGLAFALAVARRYRATSRRSRRDPPARTPRDWQRVQDLLNAAVELPSGERPAFVADASGGDAGLQDEVRSLLAAHARAGVLDRPAADLATGSFRLAPGSFPSPGRIADRYEILAKVGDGGMGVVYSARDLRLERVVALKFLSRDLGEDGAKERFVVEAQAAAALDHPNICTIHEIGETDEGDLFIAMPFYEGETLKQRLARGPLPAEQATDVAIQVAQGLASAHDRGIVHRDIKPANVVLTKDGVAKIVDFGVAKLVDVTLTHPGMTPGTAAYMSPEQARGEEVDGRADLWSLGVLLHEMLVGVRPAGGPHLGPPAGPVPHASTGPDPLLICVEGPRVPAALDTVVRRALASAREDRYPTARAMAQALEAARAPPDAAETSTGGLLPEGEWRRVTVVASTLSGYDGMVGRLAPEEVERLADRIREAAAAVADLHGGTLDRFAGDEVILLFGVPVTHEDDGVRAVRSALELHARVRALSEVTEREGGPRLRLHTGIDTGRVIVTAASATEDRAYRIVGAAGQIALRLASHAGAGEVWASAECERLIAPLFETEPQGALAVRDREQPLIPHCVVREAGSQARLVARGAVGLTPYVGRTVEMATLQRCLESALRGEGRFVTVTGEAGIGKSRLLHEFRATLDGELVSCVLGRCQSDGGGVPYLPFVEILRGGLRLGEAGPGGVLASTVARIREIGAELEEFIPLYLHLLSIPGAEFPMPRDLDGDSLRLALREALAAVLTLSARRQPIVVLVEDGHWADDASRAVLEELADLVSGHPLLVVVTTRPGSGMAWRAAGQPTSIQLLPLDPSSLAVLLKCFLRVQNLSEDLGALLQERTGGNPFFLEEICTALVEEGALRIEGGEARPSGPLQMLDLPDSIEAVIRARLDRLDRNARDVLRLASVVGREFTRAILEQTVADGARLPEALDALKAAGLVQQTRIVPAATYRFKHVLTREVAYASLLEHQRRDLHGRVGARIEQLGQDIEDHLERLAHHFTRAEAWGKAIAYGIRSADRAGGLAQYAEALQILERTQRRLIGLPEGGERQDAAVEILLRQERLCETMGLRGRQRQIIDELIRLLEPGGDPAKLAEAYLRQGDLHALLRHFEEGEEALQRSLLLWRELSDETGERRTLRSLGLLRWYEGRHPEALTCIEAVIAIDREREDVVALLADIMSASSVLKAMGLTTQAILRLQEGLAIAATARAAGSPLAGDVRVKEAYILNSLSNLRKAGDLAGALEHLDRADEIAEVKRLPVYLSYNRTLAAHIYLQQGRIEESLARYREAVELTRKARFVPGLAQTLRIHGEVLLGLSRFDEAIPCLEEAAELFAQLEDPEAESLMWAEIAGAREGAGDDMGAIAAWSASRALRQATGDAAGELEALEGLAAALRRHDPDPSAALGSYHHAAELAESLGRHAVEGRLRNVIGILEWSRGEYGRALRQYERALILFRTLGDAPNAGLMLNSIAVTLAELDRTAEARGRLDEAIILHRETGQLRLEGHALAALGDLSSRAGDAATAGRHYERSLEIRRRIGDSRGEGWMLLRLARNGGAGERAAEWTARASRIAEGCGDHELAAACARLQRTPTA